MEHVGVLAVLLHVFVLYRFYLLFSMNNVITDTPSGRGSIMMINERPRVLWVHSVVNSDSEQNIFLCQP